MVTRSNEAKQWAAKINQTIATRSHDSLLTAQEYVDELKRSHPSFLNEATLAQAVRDVDAMQALYSRDSASVQDLLAKFADVEKRAGGVVAKSDASLDELSNAVTSLQQALGQATSIGDISWADSPDKKFAAGINQLQNLLAQAQSKESSAVRSEIDAISQKADAVFASNVSLSEKASALGTLDSRVKSFKDLTGLDEDTRNAVASLSQKLDQGLEQTGVARTMANELDNIRHNAISADDLKQVLSSFIQRLPTDPRTSDFTTAVGRLGRAKDVEAWRDISTTWGGQLIPANTGVAQNASSPSPTIFPPIRNPP